VRFDVLQSHALSRGNRRERTNLIHDEILDIPRCDVQLTSAKSFDVRESRMGADRNVMRLGKRDRISHDRRPAGVKTAGYIC
jgi:hypothetical protein